jgi:hypothetical protein
MTMLLSNGLLMLRAPHASPPPLVCCNTKPPPPVLSPPVAFLPAACFPTCCPVCPCTPAPQFPSACAALRRGASDALMPKICPEHRDEIVHTMASDACITRRRAATCCSWALTRRLPVLPALTTSVPSVFGPAWPLPLFSHAYAHTTRSTHPPCLPMELLVGAQVMLLCLRSALKTVTKSCLRWRLMPTPDEGSVCLASPSPTPASFMHSVVLPSRGHLMVLCLRSALITVMKSCLRWRLMSTHPRTRTTPPPRSRPRFPPLPVRGFVFPFRVLCDCAGVHAPTLTLTLTLALPALSLGSPCPARSAPHPVPVVLC